MAETLGSLCDKLTIVKLKQWHTEDAQRLQSLEQQQQQLQQEIDEFTQCALSGQIPLERLTFAANKVYRRQGNEPKEARGSIGELFAQLAQVNCQLWHEQEKVYCFEDVPMAEKDSVVKNLALLNLGRTNCIDAIDRAFGGIVERALSRE
jgi:hypothetical protein